MISNVQHVVDAGFCVGCGSCFECCPRGAITTEKGKQGFPVPKVSESCVNCAWCLYNCPGVDQFEED